MKYRTELLVFLFTDNLNRISIDRNRLSLVEENDSAFKLTTGVFCAF